MERIKFTASNGQQIALDSRYYRLVKINGLGAAKTEIQTQKSPYQDGVTFLQASLEPRYLELEVAILADTPQQLVQLRREVVRVFNSKLGPGTLLYESLAGAKEIEAIAELAPDFPEGPRNQTDTFQRAILSLFCPSPFWLDQHVESEEIVTWIGGLTFPLVLPASFATKGPPIINIINRGDVETPVCIEFKGPATHPRITNRTTGEYIQVNRQIAAGDVLTIATEFGAKRVEINGQNAFHWIDLGSAFWQLQIGDNIVEYSSDDQLEPAAVAISYRNRYVGV